jgi:hypothetical protein
LTGFINGTHAAPADEPDDFQVRKCCGDLFDGWRWRDWSVSRNRGVEGIGEKAAGAESQSGAVSSLVDEGSAGRAIGVWFSIHVSFLTGISGLVASKFKKITNLWNQIPTCPDAPLGKHDKAASETWMFPPEPKSPGTAQKEP